jgi:hypothetical protein
MRVHELIKRLNNYPPDAVIEVQVWSVEGHRIDVYLNENHPTLCQIQLRDNTCVMEFDEDSHRSPDEGHEALRIW